MREILLYGPLAEAFGERFVLDVRDVFEAVQALSQMIPGFEREFVGPDQKRGYHIFIGDRNVGERGCALSSDKPIKIVPAIGGAGFGDIFQIVLGAVLIAASFFVPGGQAVAAAFFNVGVALTINGLAGLLTPIPKADSPKDQRRNTVFDGAQNLAAAGNPVPVLLGQGYCGSVVVSISIRTEQILD